MCWKHLTSKTPDRPYLDQTSCCAYSLFSLVPPLLETTANMDILRKKKKHTSIWTLTHISVDNQRLISYAAHSLEYY